LQSLLILLAQKIEKSLIFSKKQDWQEKKFFDKDETENKTT